MYLNNFWQHIYNCVCVRLILEILALMNVKKFLTNSIRRSIDGKINALVINKRMSKTSLNKTRKTTVLASRMTPLPGLRENVVEQTDTLTERDISDIYLQKCKDMKLKPNPSAQKKFVEQFLNSIKKKSLRLSGLGLGPRCISNIIKILRKNKQFVFIDLSLNKLGDEGAKLLSQFISMNPPIISLDLRSNNIDTIGLSHIFRSLSYNHHISDLDLSTIDGTSRNRIGTNGCIELANLIEKNSVLANLNLSMCGITAKGCEYIGCSLPKNDSLITLDLTANGFGGYGAAALFGKEKCFGSLRKLVLVRNSITDSTAEIICRHLPSCKSLRILDLGFNSLGVLFLKNLCVAYSNGCTVSNLSLTNNNLNGETTEFIKSLLVEYNVLKHLNLSSNPFRDNYAAIIARALQYNMSIESLDLSDTIAGDETAIESAEAIKKHPSLQRLMLASNHITDKGGVQIVRALQNSKTLSYLSLRNNELRDETASAIQTVLAEKQTAADIDILYNSFGYKSYFQLSRTIGSHKSSKALNFDDDISKHIEWLRTEEQRLFKYRSDIREHESEVELAEETKKDIAKELEEIKKDKYDEILRLEKQLEGLRYKYEVVSEERRLKSVEFQKEKSELEKRQREADDEYQRVLTTNQTLLRRLEKSQQKKLTQQNKASKELENLRNQLEEAKQGLQNAIQEVLKKKKELEMKEAEEEKLRKLAESEAKKLQKKEKKNSRKKKSNKIKKAPTNTNIDEESSVYTNKSETLNVI